MEHSQTILGVSKESLIHAERQLSRTLPIVIFVVAAGSFFADAFQYFADTTAYFIAGSILGHLILASVCLVLMRRPLPHANQWALAAFVYFATLITLRTYLYPAAENLLYFGILNLGAFYFLADRRYLIATQVYALICVATIFPSAQVSFGWQSELLFCFLGWFAGAAIHLGRIAMIQEMQETRDALQAESAERRKAEELSMLAKKREELDSMVSTVAEDFNNHVMSIKGGIELAAREDTSPSKRQEFLSMVMESANAATDRCQDLLNYTRGNQTHWTAIDLKDITEEAIRHAGFAANMDIQIHSQLDENPISIEGDPKQIRQAMINLLANAAEVARTKISIRSHTEKIESQTYAGVTIRDDGPSIPAHMRERIFDPFFTTKRDGRGLGLAAAAATVKYHGGRIEVDPSELGTQFKLLFPIADSEVRLSNRPDSERDSSSPASPIPQPPRFGQNTPTSVTRLFEEVFDQLPYLIFYKNTKNQNLRVNRAVAQLRSLDADVMDDTPAEVWHPDEADAYYQDDLEVIHSGNSKLGILEQIEVRPGVKRLYRTDKHPWRSDTGEVVGVLVISQLVEVAGTDEKQSDPRRDAITRQDGSSDQGALSYAWIPPMKRLRKPGSVSSIH